MNPNILPNDRRFGYYIAMSDGTMTFRVHGQVADDKVLSEFKDVVQVIFDLQPLAITITGVERNHNELIESAASLKVVLDNVKSPNDIPLPHMMDGMIAVVQRVSNFISSATGFLGQAESSLNTRFGGTSELTKAWVQRKRDLHASSFAYRFLYTLRNFSQHYGIPVSNLRVEAQRDAGAGVMRCDVAALISRNDLLSKEFNWPSGMKEALQEQPDAFDILPLTFEFLAVLRELALMLFQMDAPRLASAVHYFDTIRRVLLIPDLAVPVIFVGPSPAEGFPPTHVERVPMAQVGLVLKKFDELMNAVHPSAE